MTTKRNVLGLAIGAALIIVFFMTPAFPQGTETGGITGVVKDPQGATVPGAKVEIYNERTGTLERGLTTQSDGTYTATLLRPGSYRVEITAASFKRYRAVSVQVRITETTRHDAILQLGEFTQSVEVEATPTLISTENATTGQPIDSHTLTSLPLASPNYLFLLTLSAGTAGEPTDVRSAGRGTVDINVNGQRTSNNSVSLEGINVNDFNLAHFDTVPLPNPNTIQEFKVATSLYDASQGSKGGGAVALVLKSGTKDVHSSAYWQHRNDALNANEWFRNRSGSPRGRLLQNVFGGNASGPVWKLGGFWFVNYQGVRARNGLDPNGSTLTPTIQNFPTNSDGTTTAALLASAFSTASAPLTAAQIDPVAVNILNQKSSAYGGGFLVPRSGQPGCPTATSATATFKCTFSGVAPVIDDQYTISYDRSMRQDKDKLSVRWFYDNSEVSKPFGTASSLAFPRNDLLRGRFISITETHLISSRQTNEFRFGYNRFNSSFAPTDLVSLSDIHATRPNAGAVPGMYRILISNLFQIGTGVNDERGTISNQFFYADSWSMTVGKHTFRAGGEITRYQLNRFNRFAIRGALTFASATVGGISYSAFQNFLQGRLTSSQSAAGDPQRYFRALDAATFFQDDWRVHPRLSLNLGLRYELLGSAHDKFFRGSIYDPRLLAQNPPQYPFRFAEDLNLGGFTGQKGVPACTLNSCYDKKDFAPRVGFAWDARGNQKLVVRGGYGIYYQRVSNQNLLQGSLAAPFFVQLIDSPPVPPAMQLQNPLANQPPSTAIATAFIPQIARFAGLRRLSGPGPLDPNDPNVGPIFINSDGVACAGFGGAATNCAINLASFTTALPEFHAPYTQQWNLGVQRELGRGWALEMEYVGTHSVGGLGIWDPFLAPLVSPTSPITVKDINGKSYTITTNTKANEPLRHQILGLSRTKGARVTDNIGQATYHSGQVTLSRRFHGGLFFQSAYTYSKSIDNVSGSLSTDELNATRAGQLGANIFRNDPRANKARGDFDRPHRLIISYAWDLPVSKNGIWGSQAFQGWTVSGIVTFQSALPFSLTDSGAGTIFGDNGNGSGFLLCRPLAQQITTLPTCTPEGAVTTIGQALLPGALQDHLDHYLNPNFFTSAGDRLVVPANSAGGATAYGNIPRNAFRAPFQQNWDFSVIKKFHIRERHKFEFRADMFNLWNHPIFQTPDFVGTDSPGTFGSISTTAIPARLIQFGLRYDF